VQATADTLQHFSLASRLIINESKSAAYYWDPKGGGHPSWSQRFGWQWAQASEISKLLGLTLVTQDVDSFLLVKVDKKIQTWSKVQLNLVGREIIANNVLTSTLLYFLGIWGGTKTSVAQCTNKIHTFFWSGSEHHTRARTAWSILCLCREDGGLNFLDPQEACTTLMYKWVATAYEPRVSNFKAILHFWISQFQPHPSGKWDFDLS
jgi:hypothetical protein